LASGLLASGTAAAGNPARVDGWTGPFKDLRAATGSKAEELPQMPDMQDPLINPVQKPAEWKDRLPIDGLQTYVRSGEWRIAAHTAAGWFDSPALGAEQSHSHCSLDSTAVYGTTRLAIVYLCSVGESSSAAKLFAMMCGVDSKGRPGCGTVVMSAHNVVHRGGTDTVHDTVSCKATFHDDTIALEPKEPEDEGADGPTKFRHELEPCATTEFALSASTYPTTGAKSRRFDEAGRSR
jgi:hypothetical protein